MNFKNSMRFSIMHLYNKKSIFILSSIIMLVGIIVTYSIFSIYFISYKDILNTRNIFGSKRSHLYKINCGYNVPDYHYYEKYRDFLIELKEKYPVSVYETTDITFEDNSNFALLNQIQQNSNTTSSGGSREAIPLLKIDNELLRIADIRTEKNERLQLDSKENLIEAAAGSSYKNVVQIGDTFEDKRTGQKYVITSFLDENQKWISSGIYNSEVISLDSYFITPINLNEYTDFGCTVYIDNIYLTLDPKEADKTVKEIEDFAKSSDIYIDIVSYKENEAAYMEENKSLYNLSLLLSVIMFITVFVVIGIMAILSWMFDYHDIGILYANGFSHLDIRKIILHENLIKMVFPVILSYGYMLSTMPNSGLDKPYMILIYSVILFIYALEMFLCSYLSYCFIRRHAPIQLLGGERL